MDYSSGHVANVKSVGRRKRCWGMLTVIRSFQANVAGRPAAGRVHCFASKHA